jgi:hypothetical protein
MKKAKRIMMDLTPEQQAPREAVLRSPIGLTELAWSIVDSEIAAAGCSSRSDYLEWLILCQRFPAAEATALWNLRRRRGGLGGVYVVPDDFQLPLEG